jgi:hypothetical protein
MEIGVLGMGMVGQAVHDVMRDVGHTTCFFDPKFPGSKFETILNAEIVFVCVPTKPGADDKCDLSILRSVLDQLHEANYRGVICIKSTVLPGTTNALIDFYSNSNICFCPEFLRERSAYDDYRFGNPICVVGTLSDQAYAFVYESHAEVCSEFKKVAPKEAELTKYFQNVYNTNRVLFANAFYEVCIAESVDYDSILDSLLKRNEMDDRYLRCGPTLRGPSGPCLVKDTLAFRAYVSDINLPVRPKQFDAMVHDLAIYPKTVIEGTRTELEYFGEVLTSRPKDNVSVRVPVSVGELFDKITILEIKLDRINDQEKLSNVKRELEELKKIKSALPESSEAEELFSQLLNLNEQFWEYHDWQREAWKQDPLPKESLLERGREEHLLNDRRASIKKRINDIFKSEFIEEKQYISYAI